MTQLALAEAVPLAHALVARVARDSDVRVLFIKGPQAEVQGLRAPRTSVDVDVLVDPARRPVLAEALARHGWVDDNPRRTPTILPRHSLTVRQPTWLCELDLHDHFPGFFADHQHVFETLWARRAQVEVAGCRLPVPDVAGHALVLALHALRDPHDPNKQSDVADLAAVLRGRFDDQKLRDLSGLAVELGAADTAAPFLAMVSAPELGRGSTSPDDLRAWRLRTEPERTTAISWVAELRRQPWYRWPRFLWYAALLSEEELRLADPTLPEGPKALREARRRRLRLGLSAMPDAIASIRRSHADRPVATRRPRVVVVQEILTAYRVPFWKRLRDRLEAKGVELVLVHGFPEGDRASRSDQGALEWALTTDNRHLRVLPGRTPLVWQPLPRSVVRRADVVVVEQANRQLVNYRLLLRAALRGRPRVVFWGHGGNLRASGPLAGLEERFKGSVSRRAHWWLAYTEGSADRVAALGFPRERVTVVQ
ncbi:MAG: nucleotidyltransferase family protein, partial [Nocardioides sp.]